MTDKEKLLVLNAVAFFVEEHIAERVEGWERKEADSFLERLRKAIRK